MAKRIGIIIGVCFVIFLAIALIAKKEKMTKILVRILLVFLVLIAIKAVFTGEYVVAIGIAILVAYGATR